MDTYASTAGKQICGPPGMEQISSKHFSRSVLNTEQSNRLSFVQGGRGGFDQVGLGVGQAGGFQLHLFQLCTGGFSQQSDFHALDPPDLPALPELQLSTDGFSQVGFSQVDGFGFCQAGGFGFCQVGGFSHEDDFELLLVDPPQLSHEDDFELLLVDPPQLVALGSLHSGAGGLRDSNPRLEPHFGFSHEEGFSHLGSDQEELLERPCEMKMI